MDAGLSRARITKKRDPHDWNSYDHYRSIHDKRLAEHPFVDTSRPDSIEFEFVDAGYAPLLHMYGQVYCKRGLVLEVGKWFETRQPKRAFQIRGISYRYVVWITSDQLVLKYHNLHENPEEYHHRVYDLHSGAETLHETLTRLQFPTFTEVLDEAARLTQSLESLST